MCRIENSKQKQIQYQRLYFLLVQGEHLRVKTCMYTGLVEALIMHNNAVSTKYSGGVPLLLLSSWGHFEIDQAQYCVWPLWASIIA